MEPEDGVTYLTFKTVAHGVVSGGIGLTASTTPANGFDPFGITIVALVGLTQ
ncbi:MAG: hypothetical protein P4L43_06110 [Syntrophobacteraceae bacterium]|nr:hypothetical protein [Syntrophobacteraceae bacterium]